MSDMIHFYHGETRTPLQNRLFHHLLRYACVGGLECVYCEGGVVVLPPLPPPCFPGGSNSLAKTTLHWSPSSSMMPRVPSRRSPRSSWAGTWWRAPCRSRRTTWTGCGWRASLPPTHHNNIPYNNERNALTALRKANYEDKKKQTKHARWWHFFWEETSKKTHNWIRFW